jgi:hypothetical protein
MASNQSTSLNSTLLGGYNFGFDQNSAQLTGSHFKDPILVSAIAVNGICVASFAALVIVSWWMKGKRSKGRKVFVVLYGLTVAMFLFVVLILYLFKFLSCGRFWLTFYSAYGRTMAEEMVHEYGLDSIAAYLALPIIKQVLANGTDTTLIFVVYGVINNRLRYVKSGKMGYEPLQLLHLVIFLLMLLFGIADAGLYSYAQVYISNDIDSTKAANISNWYRNVHLSYVTVYCTVIAEVFACSVFIFSQSKPKQTPVS